MRNYSVNLTAASTTGVQIQSNGTLKNIFFSGAGAAAGQVEVSTSASSQIGTAQPSKEVIARVNVNAGDSINVNIPVSQALKAFDTLYFHSTGAANVATVNFSV